MGRNELSSQQKSKRRKFREGLNKPLGTETPQTISKRLCECWLLIEQKCPLYFSAQSASSIFRVTFVCSYMAVVLSPSGKHFGCKIKNDISRSTCNFAFGPSRGIVNSSLFKCATHWRQFGILAWNVHQKNAHSVGKSS